VNIQHRTIALGIAALLLAPASALAAPPAGIGGGHIPVVPAGPPVNVPPVQLPNTPGTSNLPTHTSTTGASAAAQSSTQASAAVSTTVGKVAAFNGTTLTLTLPNGTTKSFTVDAHAYGRLRPQNGEAVAVQTDARGNVVGIAAAKQRSSATVTGVSKNDVTLKLPNGRTLTVAVAPQAAAHMNLTPGAQVSVSTHDGFQSAQISQAVNESTATVTGVTKDTVTLKLPNGKSVTVDVAAQAASRMNLTPGSQVMVSTNASGKTTIVASNGSKRRSKHH
jgi:molybdopterin-binding protein